MIGQNRLKYMLSELTYSTIPHSIILCGAQGCGKHTFVNLIEDKFNAITFIHYSDKISYDFISNCYDINYPTCFVLDGDNITDKEYNALLKLFEEPPNNIWIILLVTELSSMLPTVVNRAVVWWFEPYSKEELEQFVTSDKSILKYAYTPGQVKELNNVCISDVVSLCDLIITKISKASVANTLSLTDRFKFKQDKVQKENAIGIKLFVRIFEDVLFNHIINNDFQDEKIGLMYGATKRFEEDLNIRNINEKSLFERFILRLKYFGTEDFKI